MRAFALAASLLFAPAAADARDLTFGRGTEQASIDPHFNDAGNDVSANQIIRSVASFVVPRDARRHTSSVAASGSRPTLVSSRQIGSVMGSLFGAASQAIRSSGLHLVFEPSLIGSYTQVETARVRHVPRMQQQCNQPGPPGLMGGPEAMP